MVEFFDDEDPLLESLISQLLRLPRCQFELVNSIWLVGKAGHGTTRMPNVNASSPGASAPCKNRRK